MLLPFIAIFSSLIVSLSGWFSFPPATASYPVMAAIFHFSGTTPNNLGVEQNHLSQCPSTPNCVVSQTDDGEHFIEPLSYNIDRQKAYDSLVKVLSVVPNTEIVAQTDNYIRTESTSKIMGFVDDAEFYFPTEEKVIHWRSASRLGESDLGVNRRRLEQIRFAFNDLNQNS